MGFTKEDLQAIADGLIDAFSERLARGHSEPLFADKSTEELLQIASSNTLHAPAERFWKHSDNLTDECDNHSRTLFKAPASDVDINTMESRLNMTLPDDYKRFLRLVMGSNVTIASTMAFITAIFHPLPCYQQTL